MNRISEEPVPLAEVVEILKKKEKEYSAEGKEFVFEQKRALEHAKSSVKLGKKDAQALAKEISELGLNLTKEWTVKIVDLLPESVDDVRAIFAKERFKYEEADIKKIIDVVDKFR
jgi:DNA-directed RNA polymerase subunit F